MYQSSNQFERKIQKYWNVQIKQILSMTTHYFYILPYVRHILITFTISNILTEFTQCTYKKKTHFNNTRPGLPIQSPSNPRKGKKKILRRIYNIKQILPMTTHNLWILGMSNKYNLLSRFTQISRHLLYNG